MDFRIFWWMLHSEKNGVDRAVEILRFVNSDAAGDRVRLRDVTRQHTLQQDRSTREVGSTSARGRPNERARSDRQGSAALVSEEQTGIGEVQSSVLEALLGRDPFLVEETRRGIADDNLGSHENDEPWNSPRFTETAAIGSKGLEV